MNTYKYSNINWRKTSRNNWKNTISAPEHWEQYTKFLRLHRLRPHKADLERDAHEIGESYMWSVNIDNQVFSNAVFVKKMFSTTVTDDSEFGLILSRKNL